MVIESSKIHDLEFIECVLNYLVCGTDKLTEDGLRKAMEAAFPKVGGIIVSTIAEKWIEQGRQQGIREGLLAGIELGLELKFGSAGLPLLPEIYEIEDVDVLRAIHKGLKTVTAVDELCHIYQPA